MPCTKHSTEILFSRYLFGSDHFWDMVRLITWAIAVRHVPILDNLVTAVSVIDVSIGSNNISRLPYTSSYELFPSQVLHKNSLWRTVQAHSRQQPSTIFFCITVIAICTTPVSVDDSPCYHLNISLLRIAPKGIGEYPFRCKWWECRTSRLCERTFLMVRTVWTICLALIIHHYVANWNLFSQKPFNCPRTTNFATFVSKRVPCAKAQWM